MLLDYLLAALVFLAASIETSTSLPAGPAAAAAAGAGCAVFTAFLAFAVARSIEDRMSSPRNWSSLVAFWTRTLVLFRAAALASFVFAVHGAGYGAWVRGLESIGSLPAIPEIVILLPFAAGWTASLAVLHRVEGSGAGLPGFMAMRLRGTGALLAMLVAGGAAVEALFLKGRVAEFMDRNPAALAASAAALVAAASVSVPLVLRAMWATRALREGPVSDAIGEFARAAGFRFSGVRIWETGGAEVVNAAVAGLLPGLRYVFLTRALCERLEIPQIVAVFAHEVGHVKCGHAFGFFGLAAGWAGFFLALSRGPLYPGSPLAAVTLQCAASAASAAAFILLTRRFEREADLFAARNLGGHEQLCEALFKVAALNGDAGSARSLTHSSVRSRAEFVKRTAADPDAAKAFHRANRALILAAALVGAAGLAFAAPALL